MPPIDWFSTEIDPTTTTSTEFAGITGVPVESALVVLIPSEMLVAVSEPMLPSEIGALVLTVSDPMTPAAETVIEPLASIVSPGN